MNFDKNNQKQRFVKRRLKDLRLYILSTQAAIAIAFAVVAPVLVGATGLAIDYARAYLVHQRLASALDAAALAGAASSGNEAEIEQKVQAFFNANYPPEKVGFTMDPQVTIVGDQVKVAGSAIYNTYMLRLLGIDTIEVEANTTVNKEVRGIEVVLVLDVTGSMQGQKIRDLKAATKKFIDTIFARVGDEKFLKVGLVPYSATVNVGSIAPQIVSEPYVPQRPDVTYNPNDPTQWAGCVMARDTPHDLKDSSEFEGGDWDAYWWEHTMWDSKNNQWDRRYGGSLNMPHSNNSDCNNRRTPNLGCPLDNPIVPLTSDKATLDAAANKITFWCRGGTLGNIGMAWGWRVLSKKAPFDEGADYDSYLWRKAVVMMTDGENNLWKKPGIQTKSDYSAYGYIDEGRLGTTSTSTGKKIANERFEETCNLMKEEGITIHTVVFGGSIIGSSTEQYYKRCASSFNHHHQAANGDTLEAVYEDIAKELSSLYISE